MPPPPPPCGKKAPSVEPRPGSASSGGGAAAEGAAIASGNGGPSAPSQGAGALGAPGAGATGGGGAMGGGGATTGAGRPPAPTSAPRATGNASGVEIVGSQQGWDIAPANGFTNGKYIGPVGPNVEETEPKPRITGGSVGMAVKYGEVGQEIPGLPKHPAYYGPNGEPIVQLLANGTPIAYGPRPTSWELEAVAYMNQMRAEHGLQPLQLDADLMVGTRGYLITMAKTGNSNHASNLEGASRELIAISNGDPRSPTVNWLYNATDNHRNTVLDPNLTRVALAGFNGPGGVIARFK